MAVIIQPIDYLLVAWFLLAAVSTAYVAWASFTTTPSPLS